MGDYDGATVDELREQAKRRDLPVSGTKQELVDRLEADDAEKATDEAADANPMVTEDRTLDVESVFAYSSDVRALVDDIRDRLDKEVAQPLSDAAGLVVGARSSALVGSSQRIGMHLDDVYRALDGLLATAAGLTQDLTGP